jgi:short-subunit dehydrogenase
MPINYFSKCTVLITGASAGIGYELAHQLAPVVTTMILLARRNYRLETLEWELKGINPELKLFSRALDLRHKDELERFCDWLDESGLAVDLLINNAGLGDHGPFLKSDWERVHSMLQVNVYALTYLTFRVLPAMRKAGGGAILNVSSIAGMLPVPNSAVYAATKAYVNSFNEAIRAELRPSHISVTALCPGPVETEFLTQATRAGERPSHTAPSSFVVPVQEVVRKGLEAITKDRARVIPGATVHLAMTAIAFVPMFIKRLVFDARIKHRQQPAPSGLTTPGS